MNYHFTPNNYLYTVPSEITLSFWTSVITPLWTSVSSWFSIPLAAVAHIILLQPQSKPSHVLLEAEEAKQHLAVKQVVLTHGLSFYKQTSWTFTPSRAEPPLHQQLVMHTETEWQREWEAPKAEAASRAKPPGLRRILKLLEEWTGGEGHAHLHCVEEPQG